MTEYDAYSNADQAARRPSDDLERQKIATLRSIENMLAALCAKAHQDIDELTAIGATVREMLDEPKPIADFNRNYDLEAV